MIVNTTILPQGLKVVRMNIVLSIECLLVGCQQMTLKRFRMIVVIIALPYIYIGAMLGDS